MQTAFGTTLPDIYGDLVFLVFVGLTVASFVWLVRAAWNRPKAWHKPVKVSGFFWSGNGPTKWDGEGWSTTSGGAPKIKGEQVDVREWLKKQG